MIKCHKVAPSNSPHGERHDILSGNAAPTTVAVPPELIQEAIAAASLTEVLLKLTGEAGLTFLEPILR